MSENKIIRPDSIEYGQWRPRFLNTILRVSCGLGIVLFGVIAPLATPIELTVLGVVYSLLLTVTFTPVRYTIKAGTFLAIGYFIGLFTLTRFGPWSDAAIFFLTCTVFASLLFDQQIDRGILVLNSTTIIVMGTLDFLHIFKMTSTQTPPANLGNWITYCVNYIVLAIVLLWGINLVKQEFRSITEKFQSTLKSFFSERSELEQRVEERTVGLFKKTEQFRAAAYIARQTTEVDDLSLLLKVVVNLITDQFGFYHTGIFLANETGDMLVLQAASSNGGKRMVEMGTSLPVGTRNIVGYAAAQRNYHIADDTGTDADLFNNPDLPDTRSEIAFPLIIRNRVLGVLDIQSDQPQAFSVDDVDVLQTLAGQVAAAIENARLLDESRAALIQLEAVTTLRTREAWRQKIQNQIHAFTYTPLGIRADAFPDEKDKALTVPIALRGQKIGSLSISRKDDENWNKVDEELINEVAYQVGLVVDNIRLLEDATQRAQQEKTVGELAVRFSQALDLDSLLQTAARELGQVPEISEVSVFIGELPEQSSQKRRSKRTTG